MDHCLSVWDSSAVIVKYRIGTNRPSIDYLVSLIVVIGSHRAVHHALSINVEIKRATTFSTSDFNVIVAINDDACNIASSTQ